MLANYEIYQGIYEISETINGQPSWIKDNRAIWYTEANSWVIGGLQYIGSLYCKMYTYPSSGGLTDELNDWKYYDGQGNSLRSIDNKTLNLISILSNPQLLTYRKVASSKTSHLEAHADFFRLFMKGIFDAFVL